MKAPIKTSVGFADAEIVFYAMRGSSLRVCLNAWNGTRLKIEFKEAVGVVDMGAKDISDLCSESGDSTFLREVVARLYESESSPERTTHNLYQFLDLDGEPVMQVVASTLEITHSA